MHLEKATMTKLLRCRHNNNTCDKIIRYKFVYARRNVPTSLSKALALSTNFHVPEHRCMKNLCINSTNLDFETIGKRFMTRIIDVTSVIITVSAFSGALL